LTTACSFITPITKIIPTHFEASPRILQTFLLCLTSPTYSLQVLKVIVALDLSLSLTHTHTHTHGRTSVDEGSARRRDLTTHNIHSRQPCTGGIRLRPRGHRGRLVFLLSKSHFTHLHPAAYSICKP